MWKYLVDLATGRSQKSEIARLQKELAQVDHFRSRCKEADRRAMEALQENDRLTGILCGVAQKVEELQATLGSVRGESPQEPEAPNYFDAVASYAATLGTPSESGGPFHRP